MHPRCAQGQGQRSRDKGHFCTGTKSASWRLLGYVELFIIRVKFAIYYFLHFSTTAGEDCYLRFPCYYCDYFSPSVIIMLGLLSLLFLLLLSLKLVVHHLLESGCTLIHSNRVVHYFSS